QRRRVPAVFGIAAAAGYSRPADGRKGIRGAHWIVLVDTVVRQRVLPKNRQRSRHFLSQDRPRRRQGGCHDEAGHIRCNDPRGRWRVLRSGGAGRRRQDVHRPWDFIETDCQVTWYGITLYGVIDAGFGYQTHGAPFDPRSPPGASYLVQKTN